MIPIVKRNIMAQDKGSRVFNIARDVDTRTIHDFTRVPGSIVFISFSLRHLLFFKERQKIAIAINNVSNDRVCACSIRRRFSKYYSASSTGSPPSITIDDVILNRDFIAYVAANSRICAVVDFISYDNYIARPLDCDSIATVITPGTTKTGTFIISCPFALI